jgi:coenzyme F420-reducing hydrogenase delta subunit
MNTFEHVNILKKILNHLGISEDRIQQYFCSAAEVEKFLQSVEDITKKIEALPPLPRFNPNENELFKKILVEK